MRNPPQEPDVVPGRSIKVVGLGVIVTTIAAAIVAYLIGLFAAGNLGYGSISRATLVEQPEPANIERVPFSREAQGLDDRAAQERVLTSYGWVDRKGGIVRVPIDVAMELYLERRAKAADGVSALRGGSR